MKKSFLILENGSRFEGLSWFSQKEDRVGEVVFTTGMTGYVESLTDPSYSGQILNFTFPLIGNYGVSPSPSWESDKIYAQGVVVSEGNRFFSHFQSERSLLQWLEEQNVPLITNIDTRALTKTLRENGTLRGVITEKATFDFPSTPINFKIQRDVKRLYGEGKKRIVAVDFGMKESMLSKLLEFPVEVLRVSSDYDYSSEECSAIFLSNGPGDPSDYTQEIQILKKAMVRGIPIFGVCLGCQILSLAAGGSTYKLKYGHRGHNLPCMDLATKSCYITSQNHGYAIDKHSLKDEWKVSFVNLNDNSVEGISHATKPFFAVQFHPEANPGPTETQFLFERFYQLI